MQGTLKLYVILFILLLILLLGLWLSPSYHYRLKGICGQKMFENHCCWVAAMLVFCAVLWKSLYRFLHLCLCSCANFLWSFLSFLTYLHSFKSQLLHQPTLSLIPAVWLSLLWIPTSLIVYLVNCNPTLLRLSPEFPVVCLVPYK